MVPLSEPVFMSFAPASSANMTIQSFRSVLIGDSEVSGISHARNTDAPKLLLRPKSLVSCSAPPCAHLRTSLPYYERFSPPPSWLLTRAGLCRTRHRRSDCDDA